MSDFQTGDDTLTSEKQQLLQLLLKKKGIDVTQKAIPRREESGPCLLSFAQQRLWFLDQWEPNNSAYDVPMAIYLTGPLRLAALEQTLNEIIERHESLRTTFSTVGGEPVQVIASPEPFSLSVVDIQEVAEADREAEARRLAGEEAQRPFDLVKGPLFRASLLRLGKEDHVLLLTLHHIVSDGWSLGVLFHEISVLYKAFSTGQPSPLSELPVQYADFAVWQRQWLQGEMLESQLSYWKKQLGENLPVLELPTDRPRPAVQTFRGARHSIELPKGLTEALKELSRREGVSLFMVLLAAFQALLYRYTGQEDVVVGSPIANRNRGEIEGLIGFFVNTLVLRSDLSGDPSFRELLGRVREVCLGAYAHQDLPFERLVEELQPERDLSRNPLFQVMFALQNAPMEVMKLSGLSISRLRIESQVTRFDLEVHLWETSEGLLTWFIYNTDLFDAATITRMAGHFQTLLEGMVADPDQSISTLPLLSEAERHQLLVAWNDTKRDYPKEKCIHVLFEEQVGRTPDAVAAVFEDQQLTYRELNRRANQLAHHLQKLGVGPEVLVGICMERSLEMLIGLLGILKAGGVYVPLDPAYPKERLAFMLEDTRVPVLLSQSRLVSQLPETTGDGRQTTGDGRQTTGDDHQHRSSVIGLRSLIICLDTEWHAIARESEENPPSSVRADNLAYVIYTSGSTGRPKGVCVTHRGVVRLVKETNYVELTGKDVFLQFAPISFDASTFEIWACLLNRAKLVVFPPYTPSLEELGQLVQQSRVTTLWLTAALFHQIVDGRIESLGGVKQLLAGGDVLSVPHVKKVLKELPGCRLINGYGPTENTTFTCCYPMTAPDEVGNSVSIGRPIANTQVYLLDRRLEPVPIGVFGELHIGGEGLARDYLNCPELTAERFIPSPFSNEPGARLYKTGDLARYLPDGNIEFLGRIDHQVKIRGFRIELGEIEAVLGQHPAVGEAVVLAREDEPGAPSASLRPGKRLVAYVVAHQGQVVTVDELRSFLKQKLPEYMIPTAFVMLDALPLTPSGKVSRRDLPAPDTARPELKGAFVAPRSPVEEALAQIWTEVLRLEQVGVHDNFFDLGGHSLLATQVISRLREILQVELPLRNLFEAPTVAGLAEKVEIARGPDQSLEATPIVVPVPREGTLPLSFTQQRLWFLDQLEPGSTAYNMPVAFRLTGPLNVAALECSINEIVRRHETLRTTFSVMDGETVQIIAPTLTLILVLADLSGLPEPGREAEVSRLSAEEAQRPFDLAQGPLLRATLLRLGDDEHTLLLTMHHIISDGWSMAVVFRELEVFYEAFSRGKPSPLPELAIQYADFAVWQRQWLQGEVLKNQVSYWRGQLAGAPAVLDLPTDRPRPAVQTFRGARHSIELPKGLTEGLKELSRRKGVSLFMVLLAAFQTLLYRYTGQEDVVVGSPIANRNRAEIEGLIGFFVNMMVLRSDLSGDPSFRELLGRVREVCLGAYAHQDLPFERLVEELHPERDLSRNPLFQVMFALQNAPMEVMKLSGLSISRLRIESQVTRFDLEVHLWETSEGLLTWFIYNTDLFDAATITRMAGHFQTLLEGMVADPDQSISTLPLLSEAERHQLLVAWNDTKRDYPKEKCIHVLFEEQVGRTPDAIAAVFEDQQLTYRELNHRANQLAHHLQKLGVGPEVLVGICMERSVDMVVGLLGILKAGGAYVPLDPEYPKERLAFMLEDTQAPVLLIQERLLARLPEHKAHVVCVDKDWEVIAAEKQHNPLPKARSDNLAYVIYTSGSTGKPKGVAIVHHSTATLLHWAREVFAREDLAGVLASTSICFDLSVFELFVPISWGGKVILAENALQLPTLSSAKDVSLINTVPSAMAGLLRTAGMPLSVRTVNLAGEPLQTSLVKQIHEQGNVERVFDLYGPSEDTTYSTFALRDGDGPATIGRPIANTQIYILDSHLQSVPAGVPGELHISGAGLARGYLNRPDLTAEKFIPNPFGAALSEVEGDDAGARLYKTGDLARYLPDGNIEFLGRIDHQVKIRGFRIELGEIEAVLGQHPAVGEAVVLAREDEPSAPSASLRPGKRLVAYVVAHQGQVVTVDELRSFLKQKLPEYMIPTAFVMLDALPLTPSGKVSRRDLPAPDTARPELKGAFVAPRSPIEEALAQIWTEVLRLEQVGVHDNFFDLGGHSLLATQVISRLREILQVELPLRNLFEAPTVAGLAEKVEIARGPDQSLEATPIVPVPREGTLPLSFTQQRLWFLDQLEPGSTAYNMPVAFRLTGPLNVAALECSINEIVRRHETLRTTFSVMDGETVQIIAPTLTLILVLADLSGLPEPQREAEVSRLSAKEAQRPFDLAQGPLLRATLLRLGDDEHTLLLTMHHIISDGWSMAVLFRELEVFYEAFSRGKPSPLPELAIQYADFAVWQRQWLQGEVLENQLSYWKRQLGDNLPVLELPTDRPRPAVQTFHGAGQSLVVAEGSTDVLKQLSRRERVTLFMTLLAAFKILLCRYSGQEDIVVGSPIAGRNRAEIEGLIGFFISTLVLRADLSGNPTFRELLGRVREVCLGAYAHQELPFEKLVEELHPERDLSHTPLFQVFFNMISLVEDRTVKLAGLKVEPFGVKEEASKFDLTMYVRDHGGRLLFSLVYNTDLFDAATITRMLGHYRTLLEGIVANPDQPISSLSLLTEEERSQLSSRTNLIRATNPFVEFRKEEIEQSIPSRFERQVERYPDHVAVRTKEQRWSYRELNRMANQAAHTLLRACGSGEQRVGLLFGHGAPMIAGILAVLKAGKTYVPLDPTYPTERLAYVLEDSQATALLTDSSNMGFARTLTNGTLQVIDIDEAKEAESADNPDLAISPDTLAYILYTSGSTGQPKGVMQNHRNVLHHIRNYTNNLHIKADDRLTLLSSYSFDAAVMDIFGALLNGAALYPMDIRKEEDSSTLFDRMIKERISIYHSTPTVYRYLVGTLTRKKDLSTIRFVVLGGEEVQKKDVDLFKQYFSAESIFVNGLGPTESTVTLQYFLNHETQTPANIVPVGYPVEETEVLLLDQAGRRAEVYGEIGIRSAHVALGYWQRPEMTEAAFLADPEGGGKRIYRTGDMGRLLPDGSIGFLGRKDFQVKIRGFRIELGEVEAVLSQHPGVRESIVLVREDQPGEKRLMGYVVLHQKQGLAIDELRSFLKQKLPDYMVPSAFVMLEALPLTPNGKVDRRSLPAPDQTRPELWEAFVAPRTELERTIAKIWGEELNLREAGIHDNFFDLGGHSLLIVKVAGKLGAALNKEIPIVQMFKYPTIQLLAAHLSQLQDKRPSFTESQQRAAARREALERRRRVI